MPNYYIKCDDCYTTIRECTKKEKDCNRYDTERCSKCQEAHDREELFQKVRHEDRMEAMRRFVLGLSYCIEKDKLDLEISDNHIEDLLDTFLDLING